MIHFLLSKIWKNKWIMLCLLIGNIMLIGIVSGTPVYTQAAMQRILIKDMEQVQINKNTHPATIELSYHFGRADQDEKVTLYEIIKNEVVDYIVNKFNIPAHRIVHNLKLENTRVTPVVQRETFPRTQFFNINTFEGHEEHLTLTHGRFPSTELVDGNIIEGIVSHRTLSRGNFLMNELMEVQTFNYDNETKTPAYFIKIVGVYEATSNDEFFWTINPNYMTTELLVSHELLKNNFLNNEEAQSYLSANWIVLLDYYSMTAHNIPGYMEANKDVKTFSWVRQELLVYKENFISTLEGYVTKTEKLTVTLLVLQVPIYIFLAFYIYIITRQILKLEQNDISVLKSRGVSRLQIILIYFLQSIFISLLSVLIGIPLGMLICKFLGASNGFLELVSRAALSVRLNRYAFIYSGIAVIVSTAMMLIPVIGFSKITIVDHKRSKSNKEKKPVWQRYFLDVLFLGISVYGYYNYLSRREIMALAITEIQTVDPLLFVSSSLFIIGLGLLCLRIYPYIIKLFYIIGNKIWSPAFYVSLLKVIRFTYEEQFIMIFLIFTLSLGLFSAKTARTLNSNNEDIINYQFGADLIIAEKFKDNIPPPTPMGPQQMPERIIYTEPDFQRFATLPEVDAVAKVMVGKVNLRKDRTTLGDVTMMAIDTKTFGETVWFRDDLLPVHMNFFLNTLAIREDGVLLSYNFKTRYQMEVGEWVSYSDKNGNSAYGYIVGFITHWPGFTDRIVVEDPSGTVFFEDNFLIVTNLGRIHSLWGMYPYQIWMRTNTPSNRFIYDFVEENLIILTYFKDTKAEIVSSRNNPILQGTNGVLTIGFILIFVACFTGFLIYWTLSIKSRVLQFGVLRAMGMTKRNLLSLLTYEQFFISFSAILIGVLVGEIASYLFVPLIQTAYSPSLQVIPLKLVVNIRDYINIFAIVGIMVAICLVILGILISKVKIAQALKLGED